MTLIMIGLFYGQAPANFRTVTGPQMTEPIQLTDAAQFYSQAPHQKEAWEWLQSIIRPKVLEEFAERYRAAPEVKPIEQGDGYITPELMHLITGHKASSFDAAFCNDFNEMIEFTGFDQHIDALQMLTANLCHETCGFIYMKEIDPGYYLDNRTDLGNVYPGDGPKFRGCGVLQLTGRANHQRFADWLRDSRGIDDGKIMELGTDYTCEHYPFQSAICWLLDNDLLNVCLKQGFESCCVRINGGYNGYEDRCKWWDKCKQVMH